MKTIRIGTRGSKLALIQSRMVSDSLQLHHPGMRTEICVVETSGDKDKLTSLSSGTVDGFFTGELEQELQSGTIDLAVHSLKDLPAVLPEDMLIASVLPRHNPQDVLVSTDGVFLNSLKPGSRIATSSKGRTAQLNELRADVEVIDIRGNVEERIQKMHDGYCDAMILAKAGLDRMGLSGYISDVFECHEMIPSACQGIIAIEVGSGSDIIPLIQKISDPLTFHIAVAERKFVEEMQLQGHYVSGCLIDPGSDRIFGYNVLMNGTAFLRKEVVLDIFGTPGLMESPDTLSDQLVDAAQNMAAEFDIRTKFLSN